MKCCKCGRAIKSTTSIVRGMGPVCAKKEGFVAINKLYENKNKVEKPSFIQIHNYIEDYEDSDLQLVFKFI